MNTSRLIPLVLAFTAGPVLSQQDAPDFSAVDANGDAVLSVTELKTALPTLSISDANGDGLVNRTEAEAAIPGLLLAPGAGEGDAPIGESEYTQIVAAVHLEGEADS